VKGASSVTFKAPKVNTAVKEQEEDVSDFGGEEEDNMEN
jgi:hypothetical protein